MNDASLDSVVEEQATHPLRASWHRSTVLQIAALFVLVATSVYAFALWRTGSAELAWPWLRGQRLLFEPAHVELGTVPAKSAVDWQIRVVNLSSEPLTLLGSQKSCGCISLEEFPVEIPASTERRLQLKIGTSEKSGRFEHSIKFFSDEPGRSSAVITVSGIVP